MIESRSLILREIEDDDIGVLFRMRCHRTFLRNCTFRGEILSESDFAEELSRDFAHDRHLQMLIIDRASGLPLGTIFSYDFNGVDEYAFISIFVNSEIAGRWTGAEATAAFVFYLFENFELFKIYIDVYGHNQAVLSILRREIFKEEGLFRGHRKKAGERVDVHRFALYRDDLDLLRKFQRRLVTKKE